VLSDHDLAFLTDIFDRDLLQLGSWLGAPLDCASFQTVTASISPTWIDGLQETLPPCDNKNLATS
jgi:hypothetical protein